MSKLYSDLMLAHYRAPQNFGKIQSPDAMAEKLNPLCGDEIKVYLKRQGQKIREIKYEARGCALMIAAASVLSEKIKGQNIKTVKNLSSQDLEKMLGVKVSKARESCITLALDAVKQLT